MRCPPHKHGTFGLPRDGRISEDRPVETKDKDLRWGESLVK